MMLLLHLQQYYGTFNLHKRHLYRALENDNLRRYTYIDSLSFYYLQS